VPSTLPSPCSTTLYGLLQRAAARGPAHPAVVFRGREVRYGQLLEDSDRIAALLAGLGARPGRHVAFCFRKAPEALAALFGLIRTGAAYVPLDPSWPAERREFVCREADIDLWVGNVPPGFSGLKHTVLAGPFADSAVPLAAAGACQPARGEPAEPARGVANVLYTSGSTGRPKGIEITARSLLHFARWAAESFELHPGDRVANHAPYTFDLSTLDIFAAVHAGATMCPVPEDVKVLPFQAAKFLAEQRISVWYSVPFALILMLDKLGAHDTSRLRHVIFAGEVMPKPALRALARALPRAALTNLYGPTETNVCTYHRVEAADLPGDEPLPIGRPIADTRLWLLDEDGRPRSDGGPGELLVAGPTVTTGYLGDADLTARRLVPAPDGDGLAYRTGDLVSRRADGVLLFHGRKDRLLKCRGHRIEAGEIETVLCRHPQVKEAAVFLVADPQFGDRLVAAVACDPSNRPPEVDLIAHCRRTLPPYVLPDAWHFQEALPRTDRGKVDLQALQRSLAETTP
jgi:amino acid adenylation domain-containing protein